MNPRRRRSTMLVVTALVLLGIAASLLVLLVDFRPKLPPQETSELIGRRLPAVCGKDLTETVQRLPQDHAGRPLIVLVAPSKGSQSDGDEWIADLRARQDVEFRELPVIPSKMADLMEGFIAGKMRDGLPEDMWMRVVPLFDGGEVLLDFFGDQGDEHMWAVVLDGRGRLRWFSAEGYRAELADSAVAKYLALTE